MIAELQQTVAKYAHALNEGLGAGLFLAGAEFAHGHAGLPTVRAGTATANLACHRALERADFVPAPGPARHTLPDGRELDTVWYRHEGAASACTRP
ncbi:GNAT family protein [Streptomyces sp. NPDC001868]|uniref:GNAT family N-acetyltransferase n=1 Tax=Streptomyces sp. NPDC001868 TaxID=3154401 RepID=UPI00331FECFE